MTISIVVALCLFCPVWSPYKDQSGPSSLRSDSSQILPCLIAGNARSDEWLKKVPHLVNLGADHLVDVVLESGLSRHFGEDVSVGDRNIATVMQRDDILHLLTQVEYSSVVDSDEAFHREWVEGECGDLVIDDLCLQYSNLSTQVSNLLIASNMLSDSDIPKWKIYSVPPLLQAFCRSSQPSLITTHRCSMPVSSISLSTSSLYHRTSTSSSIRYPLALASTTICGVV